MRPTRLNSQSSTNHPPRPVGPAPTQLQLLPDAPTPQHQHFPHDDPVLLTAPSPPLAEIKALDAALSQHFHRSLIIEPALTRELVSFQANKTRPRYRWYKFKEAFSASLVEYLLARYAIHSGAVLDPFAGMGTTLFTASALGFHADGIELLPIGHAIIDTRLTIEHDFTPDDFRVLRHWLRTKPWTHSPARHHLPELRITRGAYPPETAGYIERYLAAADRENDRVKAVLRFALLCVLESVSYTRKDGQYLRWDHRAARRQAARPFDKGNILPLDQAISTKLQEILLDAEPGSLRAGLFATEPPAGPIRLFQGSCLHVMPTLPPASYDVILTSPPYCNRYDYTRTYALELALLGVGEPAIVHLRQQMLSCTVENRAKDLLAINPGWAQPLLAADHQELLQAVLKHLDLEKAHGRLNNDGIARMVRGYFYEMACVIHECARVLKHNAPLFMVNDNVRYAGASVSVDMVLSHIAEALGFEVENILVLPKGKGNSSQQMGEHGRDMLRKCVYVWRRK